MEGLTEFDMAEYLDTESLQQGYLDFNAREGTPEDLLQAIQVVARSRGMTKTAREAGITRDGLYKALAPDGNPAFTTVFNILRALGYTLTPIPLQWSY